MTIPTVEDDMLCKFLEPFSTNLQHRKPESSKHLWVFSCQDEGSKTNSHPADLGTRMICDKIKSAFYIKVRTRYTEGLIVQFWAPVTIRGRQRLSTSGQPFAVSELYTRFAKYRLRSLECHRNIDVNNEIENEEDERMIISNGAVRFAFLNRLPEIVRKGVPLASYASELGLWNSVMLPICFPSQSSASCIGVIEFSMKSTSCLYVNDLNELNTALQEVGLSICHVQERIPYKRIDGLKPTSDEIEKALQTVCESRHVELAQVWISYVADQNHMPFSSSSSSSSKDTQTKHILALKLTGYAPGHMGAFAIHPNYKHLSYYYLSDMVPLTTKESLVENTLKDYQSRFYETSDKLNQNHQMVSTDIRTYKVCGLVICLRSIDTGDLCYAFEFIWSPRVDNLILMEGLLLILKGCLPNFKFASGQQLGDELHVVNSTTSELHMFKIFQGIRLSQPPTLCEVLEKENKSIVMDYIPPSEDELLLQQVIEHQYLVECTETKVAKSTSGKKLISSNVKCKTTPKVLPREAIEKQFGKYTQTEAAKNLDVSVSTLKRKCRDLGIFEWQGPKVVKKKVNDQPYKIDQRDRNEKDDGAVQDPLALNRNENKLTIKAEYANDMIKFHLFISQALFVTVEEEIGKRFKLTVGMYKLKYLDEDGDTILLTSDQDMNDCIKSFSNSDPPVVRLIVERLT